MKTSHNRVPISLTPKENEELQQLAKKEVRSKQSMAGIIYRLGIEAYRNKEKVNQQSQ